MANTINPTNRMAQEAWAKANAMGWETWVIYDQSDVLDMATVVAKHPTTGRYRVARWTEEKLSFSEWINSHGTAMARLGYSLAYPC